MQNILYRANAQDAKVIFELTSKGFDVQQADQVLSFPEMLDTYKSAMYNAALKYGDMLTLEQVLQVQLLKEKGTRIQLQNVPNMLEFILPQEYYPTEDKVNHFYELINPKQKLEEHIYQPILVDKSAKPITRSTNLPVSLVKDFGYICSLGTYLDKIDVMLKQYWYAKYGTYIDCTIESITEEVQKQAAIEVYGAPGSLKGTQAYSTKRGSIKKVFGYNLPSFILSKIVLTVKSATFTTACNAPDQVGLEVVQEKGQTVTKFSLREFGEYLLKKVRPYGTGKGTVPFNISPLALLSAFLWETRKEVPHANIRDLPDRKELVSIVNKLHQVKYSLFLDGRPNSPELAEEYFETKTHWSQTDSAIRHGLKFVNHNPVLAQTKQADTSMEL